MLIAQVSDTHLGFAPGGAYEPNRQRLDAVVRSLLAARPAPDLVLVTGDLTEHGDVDSYRQLRDAFAPLGCRVHYALGNHDLRAGFVEVWPDRFNDGFLQYTLDAPSLRCIVLDTLEEGRHGGAFCERRGAWLSARLAEASHKPTLLLLHHPPAPLGIDWIDCGPDEPWIARLAAALEGQRQVIGLLAGHVHRVIASTWRGLPLIVCPSSGAGLALDLTPIDPATPDGRSMIADVPPGYALHRWDGERLVSHFAVAEEGMLVRYTDAMQPLVQSMAAEKAGAAKPS